MSTAPVQTLMVVTTPGPVVVEAPDTTAVMETYKNDILPLEQYRVTNAADYIQASKHWSKARDFSAGIDDLFNNACNAASKAHRALTGLRAQLKAPADKIAEHLRGEIIRYEQQQEALRKAEEARLYAEEKARREAEIEEAKRQAALYHEKPEWEQDEEGPPTTPPAPEDFGLEPVARPRLMSTVPVVAGGPKMVDKPFRGEVYDPIAFLKWILESPVDRMEFITWNQPRINTKAKELGDDMVKVIPGVRGVRDKTLKRS